MDKDLSESAVAVTGTSKRKDPSHPPQLKLDKTVATMPTTTIQLGVHQATMPIVPGAFQRDF